VDALGSPGFLTLPNQIGELMQRLGPLALLAENAGGLFGAFRMSGTTRAAPSTPPTPTPTPEPAAPAASDRHPAGRAAKPTAEKSPTRKSTSKTSTTKKSTTRKSTTKRSTAKKAPAGESSSKRRDG
jgi:hypothetical protein